MLVSTREFFSAVDIKRRKQLILLLQMGLREGFRVEVVLEKYAGVSQGNKDQESNLEKRGEIPQSSGVAG